MCGQRRPAPPDFEQVVAREIELGLQDGPVFRAVFIGVVVPDFVEVAREMFEKSVDADQLVRDRLFDVDAFDARAVLTESLEWNHDVFVDLERIRVRRDGGRAGPVHPEMTARFRAARDKAFAVARLDAPHDLGDHAVEMRFIITRDVGQQYHPRSFPARCLGGIAHGLDVTLIEMLQSGQ